MDFSSGDNASGSSTGDDRSSALRRTQQEQLQHWQKNRQTLIVNWKIHIKVFLNEARLLLKAKDLISKLLCNVNQRLGSKGADEIKAHSWFRGIDWDKFYQMEAAFLSEVNDELDTQNFEKFEESEHQNNSSTRSRPWRRVTSIILCVLKWVILCGSIQVASGWTCP
ncbi:serine/threonine-protein kinase tricorner-like protein isoform X1 [Tanacetum coccineum]